MRRHSYLLFLRLNKRMANKCVNVHRSTYLSITENFWITIRVYNHVYKTIEGSAILESWFTNSLATKWRFCIVYLILLTFWQSMNIIRNKWFLCWTFHVFSYLYIENSCMDLGVVQLNISNVLLVWTDARRVVSVIGFHCTWNERRWFLWRESTQYFI